MRCNTQVITTHAGKDIVLDKLLRQIKNLDDGFGMQPLPFTE